MVVASETCSDVALAVDMVEILEIEMIPPMIDNVISVKATA
jgi:hypothetical protein